MHWKELKRFLWIGLCFWTFWMMVIFVSGGLKLSAWKEYAALEGSRIFYLTLSNYLLFSWITPWVQSGKKRALKWVLGALLLLLLFSAGAYWWMYGSRLLIKGVPPPNEETTLVRMLGYIATSFLAFIFFMAIISFQDAARLRLKNQRLTIEKQVSELNFLKSQTNPHFLFNTLNNIYGLAKEKSALAPESIFRLSQILRYMLYETNAKRILIRKEIKVVEDYIGLEKIRYDDSLNIEFIIELDREEILIPPLLLMPLVENAFKHGVSETRNSPYLKIKLQVKEMQLYFLVENSLAAGWKAEDLQEEHIGLGNIRRQLELLFGTYSLVLTPGNQLFRAELKINLNSYEENKLPDRRG